MIMGESAENYLETILILSKKKSAVRSVDIATELGYSKPSVCVAMRNLREHGYIVTDGGGSITLTESGYNIANTMFERHTILTNTLISLGVSPETASQDACKIEHNLSDETFEAIKKLYNTIK